MPEPVRVYPISIPCMQMAEDTPLIPAGQGVLVAVPCISWIIDILVEVE